MKWILCIRSVTITKINKFAGHDHVTGSYDKLVKFDVTLVSEATESHLCARVGHKKRRRKTHAAAEPQKSVNAVTTNATFNPTAAASSSSRSNPITTVSISATPSTVSAGPSQPSKGDR